MILYLRAMSNPEIIGGLRRVGVYIDNRYCIGQLNLTKDEWEAMQSADEDGELEVELV